MRVPVPTARTLGYNPPTMPDDVARRCPFCGVTVAAQGHTACAGLFRDVMSAESDLPQEAEAAAQDPARRMNQYVLVRQVGRGGMGTVWKAWDTKLHRWVALKFLINSGGEDVSRFLREARLAARLRHPNIAVIHEVGDAPPSESGLPQRQYLAMDFVDGETLATAPLSLEASLRVFAAVAHALDTAHRAGVIHRDLKPQNILLSREGWPFVADFGLAKSLGSGATLSASGSVMGTPAYMPPEQALGIQGEIDERSDLYSLGATFYRVLTGRDPFQAPTPVEILRLVIDHEPMAPRSLQPSIPIPVDIILRKCLSKSKAGRYATALHLAEDLDRALAGTKIQGRAPSRLSLFFRRSRRSAVSLLLSFLLLGAVSALAWREWKGRAGADQAATLLSPADRSGDLRRDIRRLIEARRFKSAGELIETRRPAEAELLRRELTDANQGFQEQAVQEFLRSLRRFPSLESLRALPGDELRHALALPEMGELIQEQPGLAWIRELRGELLKLREPEARIQDFLPLLVKAAREDGAHGLLTCSALWPLFRNGLLESLRQETAGAADAPKAQRDAARGRTEAILARWRAVAADLRIPEAPEFSEELARRAAEFPTPLPELEGIDPGSCLKSPDPEGELGRLEQRLAALDARTGIDIESRRKLLSLEFTLAAQKRLLQGKSEEETAADLGNYRERLRMLGPLDLGDVSPRILRVARKVSGR